MHAWALAAGVAHKFQGAEVAKMLYEIFQGLCQCAFQPSAFSF